MESIPDRVKLTTIKFTLTTFSHQYGAGTKVSRLRVRTIHTAERNVYHMNFFFSELEIFISI
jgi:hypothetical protein